MAKITFSGSGQTLEWDGSHRSILEFAEANGLNLPFGCRGGRCTRCQQEIVEGTVAYPGGHVGQPDEGKALLCCSVPEGDLVINESAAV